MSIMVSMLIGASIRGLHASTIVKRNIQTNKIVSYVTDIEGNYDYWQRFIRFSRVLYSDKSGSVDFKVPNGEIVFGGDMCDRGSGDVRVVQDIVKLKEKYPNRVHVILGNRDINKMRLTVELSKKALQSPPDVYWNKDVLASQVNQKASDRLKWILLRTMGAPIAFESRRE